MEPKKKNKYIKGWLIFIFSAFAITGIISVINDDGYLPDKDVPNKETKIVYDIPSLFGLNIDQIRKKLGKPEDIRYKDSPNVSEIDPPENESNTTDEWFNTYHKDNLSVNISFNPKTRKVNDFFIGYDRKSFHTGDLNNPSDSCVFLMESFNIKKDVNEYIVEESPLANWGINGLLITPISNVKK